MELFFESRVNLSEFAGHLNFIQNQPVVHPDPVVLPDTFADAKGLSIYGSVLRDGGKLRMWYLASPADWDYTGDMSVVAYAESEDGFHWTKPALGIVDHGPGPNNLVNLALHCPSVFIDPEADADHRYRATGCGYPSLFMAHPDIRQMGYYTAHSADGLHWTLDSTTPRWNSSDVITSIYHADQQRGIISMKYTPRCGRLWRRSIHTAEFRNGEYSGQVSALYPDEFDDMCAASRGHHSCDYYGMGMLGAGSGTVGFLWNFWHDLPYTTDGHIALYGTSDVTLVYQPDAGGRWMHVPGRPTFIDHLSQPWMSGWINTSSCPVEMGDEQWLFFSGQAASHGFYHNNAWQPRERWPEWARKHGRGAIGFVRWPKWRLFGFESDPDGAFNLDLGVLDRPSEFILNYRTRPDGAVRVEIPGVPGRSLADCLPLEGDNLEGVVRWRDGSTIHPDGKKSTVVRLHLDVATVYAYEVRAV